MIFISCGIDGSGKSTYALNLKQKFNDLEIILNFDSEKITNLISKNKNVYFLGNNLSKKERKNILSLSKELNQQIIFIIFLTSFRKDICENRIKNDLLNGIIRQDSTKKIDGESLLDLQYKKFKKLCSDIKLLEEELAEHSKEFRIKYIECQKS